MTLTDIRAEYDRLDRICGVDTRAVKLEISARLKTKLGYCQYRGKRPEKIVFAAFLFEMPEDELLDTIRHEYAHALVKLRRPDEDHSHDDVWQAAAREVGCLPMRTSQNDAVNEYVRAHRQRVTPKYLVECATCHSTWTYKRRTSTVNELSKGTSTRKLTCPHCHGRSFIVKDI